ncbi:MAG TPA: IPT/TIG domain-containing protein [Candidatus Baltobacteraceae bacterium]|nr:IPT/TIG domain-containing protein [Candidatus Baltobacteraceae bacterium]
MTKWYEERGSVALVEVLYLLILFALALLYLTPLGAAAHVTLPSSFGPLPVGVPWFGALGAVIISLSGAFDHRTDWDPTWALWHFTRPLIGVSLAIIAWLTFQAGILAVGSVPSAPAPNPLNPGHDVTAPTNLLYYLIAFVVGYREQVFRELIKRVSDVILTPSGGAAAAATPVISALSPASGSATGGDTVAITGSGFSGTTSVTFGNAAAPAVRVASDTEVSVTTPPGRAGRVSVRLTTGSGSATGGPFTYNA